jgi:dynein light intermediate chain 1
MSLTPTRTVSSDSTRLRQIYTDWVTLDTLARVSLYLLSQPSSEFSTLVAPLLTPESIPNTALVILLDWAEPHMWLRQIRRWISLFRIVLQKLGDKEHAEMEEQVEAWKQRGRSGGSTNLDGTPSAAGAAGEADTALPQGPGEWTDPLGLPLCVVCQNVSFVILVACWSFLY